MALEKDIRRTVVGYFALQLAIGVTTGLVTGVPSSGIFLLAGVLIAAHVVIWVFLYARRSDFVILSGPGGTTGTTTTADHTGGPGQEAPAPRENRLSRVNTANKLTIFRLSAAPTIVFLVIWSRDFKTLVVLIALTAAAFLTDLVDGRISRRRGEITRIGRYLDSSSDYAVLIVISIAFLWFGLIETWFLAAVMVRLGVQFVFMASLVIIHGHVEPRTSFLGKAAVFAVMVVYGAVLTRLIQPIEELATTVTIALEIAASVILAVSLVEKCVFYAQDLCKSEEQLKA